MKVLVVDNKYDNPDSAGAEGLEAVSFVLDHLVEAKDIKILQGYAEFKNYISTASSIREDDLVVLIHESFALGWFHARNIQEREAVAQVCEEVREINFRARVIIFGFALDEPLPSFVREAKADAFWGGFWDLKEILMRGPVSDEEIRQRGKTIEIIGEHKRVTEEGILMRVKREREGD